MTVAARLRLTLGVLAAVLAGVVVVHAVSMHRTVAGTRALTAIAARHETASSQLGRLGDMSAALRKFAVTGDAAYLERAAELSRTHQGEIIALGLQSLPPGEQAAAADLAFQWTAVSSAIDSVVVDGRLAASQRPRQPPAQLAGAARRVADAVDRLRSATEASASAARLAMLDELHAADRRAATVGRLFWLVAGAAVLLAALLASVVARSIISPLQRLAEATRRVSQGQFDVRVAPTGDEELATLSRDFNGMAERLEQLDRMKRDFISNVSHDLKSPLAAMQETNDVILDGLAGPLSDRQRRLLEMSRDSGTRLASMIHKLLDLSRLDSRPTPARELLDLSVMARRAVDHVNAARGARSRGPRVVIERAPEHLLVRADAEEVAQVLDNLLENAMKFAPGGSVIRVALEDDGDAALLTVADEGPGVPDEEKERIFQRFYQTEAGRSAPERGVGLGLAICRQIVDAHGGSITVRDNMPAGAVLEVRLPGAIALPAAEVAELAGAGA